MVFAFVIAAFLAALATAATRTGELVYNGGAESGTGGWSRNRGSLGRFSSGTSGKVGRYYFYGGGSSDSQYYQWVYVGGYAAEISNGNAYAEYSARVGGYRSDKDRAIVHFDLCSSTSSCGTRRSLGWVSRDDRGRNTRLLSRSGSVCRVPSNTRYIRVWMHFYKDGGWFNFDNDGYLDAISAKLILAPSAGINKNLVMGPSAEWSQCLCFWNNEYYSLARSTWPWSGKHGTYFYWGGRNWYHRSSQWISVSRDATGISRNQRSLTVSALLGGYGSEGDYSSVRVEQWNSARNSKYRDVTLDIVQAAQRGSSTKFMHIEGGDCIVHTSTRFLKLVMEFRRSSGTDNDGYIDLLDVRLVTRIAPAPSYALNRNLVWMGGGEYASWKCVWTRSSGVPISRSSPAYSSRVGSRVISGLDGHSVARAYQWIDVSADSGNIAAGRRGLKLWARQGGAGSDPDDAKVWVEAYSSGKSSRLATLTLPYVSAAWRASQTRLLTNEDGLCQLPTATRWVRVWFEARRLSGTPNEGAIDDIGVMVVAARAKPSYAGAGANLAWAGSFEGTEGHPWSCQWTRERGFPRRLSNSISGRVGSYYASGAVADNVYLYQWIDVSADATWIDRGKRRLGGSARLGGYGSNNDYTAVLAYAYNSARSSVLQNGPNMQVTRAERGSGTKLLLRQDTLPCSIPPGTRWLKLYIRAYNSGGWNDAYADDVRVQLVAVPYGLGTNLVLSPSAEHALWRCAWTMESSAMDRSAGSVPGKHGSYFYYGFTSSYARAAQWINIEHDAGSIAAGQRSVAVSALLGGYGGESDYGSVRLEQWNSARSSKYRGVTLDIVQGSQRGSATKFMHIEGGDCVVHTSTRYLKLVMEFRRYSGSGNDGYIDLLDVRLVTRIAPAPSFAVNRNLVWMGGGEYASWKCVWTRSSGVPISRSSPAYSSRVGSRVISGLDGHSVARAYQWIDVSADSGNIAAGRRGLKLWARQGGAGSDPDDAKVWVEAYSSGKSSRLATLTLPYVSAAWRASQTRLLTNEDGLCQLPTATRWVRVWFEARRLSGTPNEGAIDDIGVMVVAARAKPSYAGAGANLAWAGSFEGTEGHPWSCQWTRERGFPRRLSNSISGRVGSYYASGAVADNVYLYQWIDVSADATWIDRGKRRLGGSARLGGYGSNNDYTAVLAYAYNSARSSVLQNGPNMQVTRAERGSGTKLLLRQDTLPCSIPPGTRWLKLYIRAYNSGGWNDAYADDVRVQLVAVPYGLGTNLVLSPSAEHALWRCAWTMESSAMDRSAGSVPGKHGSYFYYGFTSSYARAAQWINIEHDAGSIAAGQRSVAVSALLGGYGGESDYGSVRLEQWNSARSSKYRDVTLDIVQGSQRGSTTKFMHIEGGDCVVHTSTRYLKLVMEFRRYTGTGNDGYIDLLDVRLVTRIASAPSFAVNRNLVWMGGGEYASWKCVWTRSSGVPISRSSPAYSSRVGSRVISGLDGHSVARAYQWIDVSADSGNIAAGRRGLKLWARQGGAGSDPDDAKVWVEAYSSGKSSRLATLTLPYVSAAWRASQTRLLTNEDGLCQLPTATRWVRVWFEARRLSGTPNEGAIDDIGVMVVAARAKPSYAGAGANLAWAGSFEGTEGHPWSCQWTRERGFPRRLSNSISGRVGSYYASGAVADNVYLYQWIDVSADATWIDRGKRRLGGSARLGGYGSNNDYTAVLAYAYNSARSSVLQNGPNMQVTRAERGSGTKLLLRQDTLPCSIPPGTRWLKLYIRAYNSGGWNDAYADDVRVQLVAVPYGLGTNLVLSPSAEHALWRCAWTMESSAMDRSAGSVPGKHGSYFYYGFTSSYARAAQWINIEHDAGSIAAGQRSVAVSALLGGYGGESDYGSVRLEQWNSARSSKYRGVTLDIVQGSQRGSATKFMHIEGGDCVVHTSTRYLKLVMEFRRYSGSGNDGYIDLLDVRLVTRIAPAPSFAVNRNLVWMGGGEYASWKCVWTRSSGVPISRSSPAYSSRVGSRVISGLDGHSVARAYQWIDVSADSGNIAAGRRGLKLWARQGGAGSDPDDAKVWVEAYSSGKSSRLATLTLPYVSAAWRASQTRLLTNEDGLCQLPTATRWVRVWFEARRLSGTPNEGAIDDIGVMVVAARAKPSYAGAGANLAWAGSFEGTEGHPWSCQWTRERGFPRRLSNSISGRVGSYYASGAVADNVYLYQWIDVSADATWIDRGKRRLGGSARLGGYGSNNDYTAVLAYAYNSARSSVLQNGPNMQVTRAERGSGTKLLLRQDTLPCSIPPGTRWLKLYIRAYNSGGWNDAYADDVRVQLVAVPYGLGTNLVLSPSAEHALWRCAWTMESSAMDRSAGSVPGKHGSYFYYGFTSSYARAAQWINIEHDAGSIAAGQRSVAVSALLGGYGGESDYGSVRLEQWNSARSSKYRDVTLDIVQGSQRGSTTKFTHIEGGDCVVHTSTRYLKLVMEFRRYTGTGNDGYIDLLDVRLVTRIASAPSFAVNRNLVWMGGGEYANWKCVWQREVGAPKTNTAAYIGRVGPSSIGGLEGHSTVRAYQWIDVSADAANIASGSRSLQLTSSLGSATTSDHKAKVWAEAWSSGKLTRLQTALLPTVTPAARNAEDRLMPREDGLCTVPPATRWVKVYFEIQRATGLVSRAAVDAVSVMIINRRAAPSLPLSLESNILRNGGGELPPWSCEWDPSIGSPTLDRTTATAAGRQGAAMLTGFSRYVTGTAVVTQWVDVSSVATDIDRRSRIVTLSGHLGGSGAAPTPATVEVVGYNAAKTTPLGTTTTIGPVAPADRGTASALVFQTDFAKISHGVRYLRVRLTMGHSPFAATFVDGLSLHLNESSSDTASLSLPLTSTADDSTTVSQPRTVSASREVTTSKTIVRTSTDSSTATPHSSVSATLAATASLQPTPTRNITQSATQMRTASTTDTATVSLSTTTTAALSRTMSRKVSATPSAPLTATSSILTTVTASRSTSGTVVHSPTASTTVTSMASTTPSVAPSTTQSMASTHSASETNTIPPTPTLSLSSVPSTTQSLHHTRTSSLLQTATSTLTGTATVLHTDTPTLPGTQTVSVSGNRTLSPSLVFTATQSVPVTPSHQGSVTASLKVSGSSSGVVTRTFSNVPTPTPSAQRTLTQSVTRSATASLPATATVISSKTSTVSATVPATLSSTQSATHEISATTSAAPSVTTSVTQSRTVRPTVTITASTTPSSTVSLTPNKSGSSTLAVTATQTGAATRSASQTLTSVPTASLSWDHTHTATLLRSVTPTLALTSTMPRTDTQTLLPTQTGSHIASRTLSMSLVHSTTRSLPATLTQQKSVTTSLKLSATVSGIASGTVSKALSQTASLQATSTFTALPTATSSPTFAPSLTVSQTETRTAPVSGTTTLAMSPSRTLSHTVSSTRTAAITATAEITPSTDPTGTVSATVSASLHPTASVTQSLAASGTLTLALTRTSSVPSTASATASRTVSSVPTHTTTHAVSVSQTASVTVSSTATPLLSVSKSSTLSTTRSVSLHASPSASVLATSSLSVSATASPTATQALTMTASAQPTPSLPHTETRSALRTDTATFEKTATRSVTLTPVPTATHAPTATATSTRTLQRTFTATVSSSDSIKPNVTASRTARTLSTTASTAVTATVSVQPTVSALQTPTASVMASSTATFTFPATKTVQLLATPTPTLIQTASSVQTHTATGSGTPVLTPSITAAATLSSAATRTKTSPGTTTVTVSMTATRSPAATTSVTVFATPSPTAHLTPTVSSLQSVTTTAAVTGTASSAATNTVAASRTKSVLSTATRTVLGSLSVSSSFTKDPSATTSVSSAITRTTSTAVSSTASVRRTQSATGTWSIALRPTISQSVSGGATVTSTLALTVSRSAVPSLSILATPTAAVSHSAAVSTTAPLPPTPSQQRSHSNTANAAHTVSIHHTATQSPNSTTSRAASDTVTVTPRRTVTGTLSAASTPTPTVLLTSTPDMPVTATPQFQRDSPSHSLSLPATSTSTQSNMPQPSNTLTTTRVLPPDVTLAPSAPDDGALKVHPLVAVFGLTGACSGRLNFLPLLIVVFAVIVVARVVYTAVIRKYRDDSPDSYETVHVPKWQSLARQHAWVGLVWPCHHYCGPDHAAIATVKVLALICASAAFTNQFAALLKDDPVGSTLVIGALASVVAVALQPPLTALFAWYTVLDRRRELHVPTHRYVPSDLQQFGVKRPLSVGLSDTTIAAFELLNVQRRGRRSSATTSAASSILEIERVTHGERTATEPTAMKLGCSIGAAESSSFLLPQDGNASDDDDVLPDGDIGGFNHSDGNESVSAEDDCLSIDEMSQRSAEGSAAGGPKQRRKRKPQRLASLALMVNVEDYVADLSEDDSVIEEAVKNAGLYAASALDISDLEDFSDEQDTSTRHRRPPRATKPRRPSKQKLSGTGCLLGHSRRRSSLGSRPPSSDGAASSDHGDAPALGMSVRSTATAVSSGGDSAQPLPTSTASDTSALDVVSNVEPHPAIRKPDPPVDKNNRFDDSSSESDRSAGAPAVLSSRLLELAPPPPLEGYLRPGTKPKRASPGSASVSFIGEGCDGMRLPRALSPPPSNSDDNEEHSAHCDDSQKDTKSAFEGFDTAPQSFFGLGASTTSRPPARLPSGVKRRDPQTCVVVQRRTYHVAAWATALAMAAALVALIYTAGAFHWCGETQRGIFWRVVAVACAVDALALQVLYVGLVLLYRWVTAEGPKDDANAEAIPHELHPIHGQWRHVGLLAHAHKSDLKQRSFAATTDPGLPPFMSESLKPSRSFAYAPRDEKATAGRVERLRSSVSFRNFSFSQMDKSLAGDL